MTNGDPVCHESLGIVGRLNIGINVSNGSWVSQSRKLCAAVFYFVFVCLLYLIWWSVDLLVQIEIAGKHE